MFAFIPFVSFLRKQKQKPVFQEVGSLLTKKIFSLFKPSYALFCAQNTFIKEFFYLPLLFVL